MAKKHLIREERMDKREARVLASDHAAYPLDAELRAIESEDGAPIIEGYAAIFDSASLPLGYEPYSFREVIRPGAFDKTLNEADVRALFNHDPNIILGRNKAGTVKLSVDQRGLKYRINVDPTSVQAMDTHRAIKRGDINQSSFGFRAIKDRWTEDEGKPILRELLEVELFDVSPVAYPAYTATSVDARSILNVNGIDVPEPVNDDHSEPEEPIINGHSIRKARLRLVELALK